MKPAMADLLNVRIARTKAIEREVHAGRAAFNNAQDELEVKQQQLNSVQEQRNVAFNERISQVTSAQTLELYTHQFKKLAAQINTAEAAQTQAKHVCTEAQEKLNFEVRRFVRATERVNLTRDINKKEMRFWEQKAEIAEEEDVSELLKGDSNHKKLLSTK